LYRHDPTAPQPAFEEDTDAKEKGDWFRREYNTVRLQNGEQTRVKRHPGLEPSAAAS
jgi:hypothetical protein